ncbi:MAG: hypothetical protein AMJ70_08175 [Dehalococcoidia bacterium SG8_51_3]|uniref:Uncharacterized protein n=1 Tax=candidate division WOR_3 bacterium SM23_42 TaxID=1703779 RepID=A0A0S8FXP3_UNCW3|nr:MAG: hypothetical protein AMJ70_08175 [Dehalococcoidia bacterium SG8_51_3]KPK64445.1 MAG: hypothetical protein AMJ83_01655 [candidate division WOR_3 bacterium SM23_42]
MKRVVAVVVMVSLLVNCAYSSKRYDEYRVKGPIVISERVGEVLDAEEKEHFGLFPKIYVYPVSYPVEAATFFELEGGGYEVRIATGYDTVVAVNRDLNAIRILRDYVDYHEEIIDSRGVFEKRWSIVGYDDLGQPITKREIERVRNHRSTVACAAGGGGLALGVGSLWAFATFIGGGFGTSEELVEGTGDAGIIMLCTAGVAILATGAGFFVGRGFDNTRARDAVEESRKPRVVE